MTGNIDPRVVRDFGTEWSRFDQAALSQAELNAAFQAYFAIFPWEELPENAEGFDLGCGSGRWATLVAQRVGQLHCIDPSDMALATARKNLAGISNCQFHLASVDAIPLNNDSMDFGYSLGVLHHVPDTAAGIRSCVAKLKRGAPLLLYLYYAFDDRPKWFVSLFRVADSLRRLISRLPYSLKYGVSQAIAIAVYFPLARLSRVLEARGASTQNIPLSSYARKSLYTMRTDALDRFGTRLEHRFTRTQIVRMMEDAGLVDIRFSDQVPHWCAVGRKA